MTPGAWAALLFVGSIWGASFLFIEVAIESVSPLQTVLFRTALGAVFLWSILLLRRQALGLTPALAVALLALSAVSTMAPLLLIAWAQTRIDSGMAAILQAMMPIFTLALAVALFEEERLTTRAVGGIGLGILGVALLSGAGPQGLAGSSFVAQMAVVLATAFYAVGNIAVRFLVRRLDTLVISATQILFSAAVVGIASAAVNPPEFDLPWKVWGALAALGIFSTGFAYLGYYWLIANAGSFRASLVTYIIPVVGVFLGVVVLGEEVNLATIAGGAIIALGVALGTGGLEQAAGIVRGRRASAA